ncbi:unnamed protein product [Lathyrus sativus]|nr:unnamed protein product [Lathyrus sativus]
MQKIKWISDKNKSKTSKVKILNCAQAETIHELRKLRDDNCFKNETSEAYIEGRTIGNIIYKCWNHPKLRKNIFNLMMP